MRFPVLASAALLLAGSAAAAEIHAPRITITQVDWAAAAASLPDHGSEPPAAEFARINAQTGKRFPGIDKSSVPVLLPVDLNLLRADATAGKPDATGSDKYFGPFHSTKYFLPGPGGYTGTFTINSGEGGFKISYKRSRSTSRSPAPASPTISMAPIIRKCFRQRIYKTRSPVFGVSCMKHMCATSSSASACLTSSRSNATTAGRRRNSSPAARPIRSRWNSCACCAPPAARRRLLKRLRSI